MLETDTLAEMVPAISIALGDEVSLDLTTLIETRLLVQANSGGGKSFALRHLLEQSHGKVQHLVITWRAPFARCASATSTCCSAPERTRWTTP